jgi:hypothetical protein
MFLGYGFDDVRRSLKIFIRMLWHNFFYTVHLQAYQVAKIAKEVREDCKVIVGPHATFLFSPYLTRGV